MAARDGRPTGDESADTAVPPTGQMADTAVRATGENRRHGGPRHRGDGPVRSTASYCATSANLCLCIPQRHIGKFLASQRVTARGVICHHNSGGFNPPTR